MKILLSNLKRREESTKYVRVLTQDLKRFGKTQLNKIATMNLDMPFGIIQL